MCRVNFLVPEHNLRTWNKLAPKACPFEIRSRFKTVTPGSIFMSFSKHGLLLISCVHLKSPWKQGTVSVWTEPETSHLDYFLFENQVFVCLNEPYIFMYRKNFGPHLSVMFHRNMSKGKKKVVIFHGWTSHHLYNCIWTHKFHWTHTLRLD